MLDRLRVQVATRSLVLALCAAYATAGDAPPAPAPVPPAVVQPQPGATRSLDPGAFRRPHQVVEVIEVESQEALSAKLASLTESGLFISSMTSVTANGKSLLVVVGMPQAQPTPRSSLGQPLQGGQPLQPGGAVHPGPQGPAQPQPLPAAAQPPAPAQPPAQPPPAKP